MMTENIPGVHMNLNFNSCTLRSNTEIRYTVNYLLQSI